MPTTDMNRTTVRSPSVASAIARVAIPPYGDRSLLGGRRKTRSARSSSRTAEARRPPTISSASPVVCRAIASRSSGLEATCRRALCISSLASTLSVSSSVCGLLRAPVDEALQLTARGELGGDALEDAVADERARELLRQRSGERPVDDPRDLGRGQDLVDGFFDRPTPGPCGRAGREEGGAPGRVCQAGLALVVLRCLHERWRSAFPRAHAPTLDYQPVARQHPSPPTAGRRRPRRRTRRPLELLPPAREDAVDAGGAEDRARRAPRGASGGG